MKDLQLAATSISFTLPVPTNFFIRDCKISNFINKHISKKLRKRVA
jgi:hypothetical protein